MRALSVFFIGLLIAFLSACKIPSVIVKQENRKTPEVYVTPNDTVNIASFNWSAYFEDPYLIALIDTALKNNQELNILTREAEIDKNEIQARKGEYLPFVTLGGATGADKSGKYTWNGLSEEDLKASPEKAPKHIGDNRVGALASWEMDIWKKLHNARKAATLRYLSTVEGRNFAKTIVVAEIARSYFELLGLDNQLAVITQNIEIQKNALQLVKYEKEAAKVTQLAVNRFEAQLLNTENLQFEIKQQITETENRIHFLVGQFPQPILRASSSFEGLSLNAPQAGLPSQLLANRPDIRQAEYALSAAKLDVQVAKANFYPAVRLTAGLGFEAFNPAFVLKPVSALYNLAGDIVAPLVNRNAIKAAYSNASLKQVTAAFNYERTILNAYVEVINDLSRLDNYRSSFALKEKEVAILNQSISISNSLFSSARADYIEVLLTQREALNSKLELIEIKVKQLQAKVGVYRSLGGGWR
ncbi:MAG: TolC family protein [Chitinophagia bacterium]|nr:TolC family protein [Chitinophagia bacterium]